MSALTALPRTSYGAPVGSRSYSNLVTPNLAAVHIGAWAWAPGALSRPFDGAIDELAVYGEVLSPGEIETHYHLANLGP